MRHEIVKQFEDKIVVVRTQSRTSFKARLIDVSQYTAMFRHVDKTISATELKEIVSIQETKSPENYQEVDE